MEVNIKTLTPLWTGGVEGQVDHIHETGILGSLRWWMEVLVRSLGGSVCDPTAEGDRNSLDQKKYHQSQAKDQRQKLRDGGLLCDVSHIFGATGWKRQFRLDITQDKTQPDQAVSSEIKLYQYQDEDRNDKTHTKTNPRWWFPKNSQDKPRSGEFTLKIQSLDPKFKPEIIAGLIQFIAFHSALGARPQMGFGVIQIEGSCIDTQPLYDWLISTAGSKTYPDMPSLQNVFVAQIEPKDSKLSFKEEDTFNLKYDLRQLFRVDHNPNQRKDEDRKPRLKRKDGEQDLRHFIMGAAPKESDKDRNSGNKEDKKMAAKVKISRPYEDDQGNTVMRVWGWIPEEAGVYKNGWDREKVVNKIYQHITTNYTLHEWREMNSARDTMTSNQTDIQVFLCSLLGLTGGQ